ncbi:hypothetical protein [Allosphingosinicella deserti]|uniref:hypothetical protein n=1 Tax=Allosphingosinicella deserti TaxID=2116704 RepID=UPI001304FE34|nr:hypothetical protein [Sphingomonas deserti]
MLIFLLGLVVYIGIEQVLHLGGPDSPGLVLPHAGLGLSLAALLAEGAMTAFAAARRHRPSRA